MRVKCGGIDCNEKLKKDTAELVLNNFLKWLLGVNKYCNNNASRAETGRFPKPKTKNEYKLSQINEHTMTLNGRKIRLSGAKKSNAY